MKEVVARPGATVTLTDGDKATTVDLYSAEGLDLLAAIVAHLARFDGLSREYQLRKLQEPYHGMHKRHLLYRIVPAAAPAVAAE